MEAATSTKERILNAAEGVVLRDGVARLTLEATAAEAGLSKGGVLYHFPSRDALVTGMVARLIDLFDRDLASAHEGSDEPGALGRAYVRATFQPLPDLRREREERLGAALVAAIAAEPALLDPLRRDADRWQSALEHDGIDPAKATVLRLAADGLWLTELFGLGTVSPDLRRRVEEELNRLSREVP